MVELLLILALGPQVTEIEAKTWVNNPSFRLNDSRTAVVLLFDTERPDRELQRVIPRLNRIHGRDDAVVIGLTQSKRQAAERFVRRYGMEFTIGYESPTARRLKVRDLPAILVFRRTSTTAGDNGAAAARLLAGELDRIEEVIPTPASERAPAELKELILSDTRMERRAAVDELFHALPEEEFAEFADRALESESNPYVRCRLLYFRELAAGNHRTDRSPSPWSLAARAYADAPDDPRWAQVRAFDEARDSLPAAALIEKYVKNESVSSDAGLLIRRAAIVELGRFQPDAPEAPAIREALLSAAANDPDPAIRMFAAMSLGNVAAVGDQDTAARLSAIAAGEQNLWSTRPMMEYVARYLRTGIEDSFAP